jgi:Zn-dependent protease
VDNRLISALITAGILLLVAFPIHEFSHAWMANRLGDRTARYLGRMSLDPRVHFDPLGGALLAISAFAGGFIFGWAKPTPVNPTNLRGGRRGEAWVALAGPISNLVMAAAFAIPVRFIWATQADIPLIAWLVLQYLVLFNVFLFIFNLIPIPPLDGYKVVTGFVSARTAYTLRQYEQYGMILILVIFLVGGRIIAPIGESVFGILVGF